MPIAHVIITPLPNGLDKGPPRTGFLSVHLAPRLREDGRLRDYPAWRNWPGYWAANAGFEVRIDGAVRNHTIVSSPPDPDVWRAVFGPPNGNQMPVRAWTFVDRRNPNLVSIDPAPIAEAAENLYLGLARGLGDREPTPNDLGSVEGLLGPSGLLAGMNGFYAPRSSGTDVGTIEEHFHAALAQLGAHPQLLRQLGLVFDLEVELPNGGFNEIQVNAPGFGGGAARPVPMRMALSNRFYAGVSDEERLTESYLRLANTDIYDVSTIDLPTLHQRLQALEDLLVSTPASEPVDLPTLEEGGVAVWQRRRAEELINRFDRQAEIEGQIDEFLLGQRPVGQLPVLFYDQVLLGARYDIMRGDNKWRSLFERRLPGGYEFPRSPALSVSADPDEGWQSNALMTDGGEDFAPTVSDVIYGEGVRKQVVIDKTPWRVPDTLTRWKGWSLAVAKPGRALDGRGRAIDQPPDEPDPADPVQLVAHYRLKNGTLPKLRYDSTYRVRARAVDLAGNSVPLSDSEPEEAVAPQVRFARMAAVAAPIVVRRQLRDTPGVGDTMGTIVIKSDLAQPNRQVEPSERLFFPPSATQPVLELHGLPKGGTDPASYDLLASRDALSLDDQVVIDPESGEPMAGTFDSTGAYVPGPLKPAAGYLSDPAADQVSFTGLPRGGGPVTIGLGGKWPNKRAARLVLDAGKGKPRRNKRNQTVTVKLQKGRMATVEVATGIEQAYLQDFYWVGELAAEDAPGVEALMREGRHAIFSDRREIVLVHAVRQPVAAPSLTTMAAVRLATGGTTASVTGSLRLDRPSTGRFVLRGSWEDPVDELDQPAPGTKTRRSEIGSVDLPYAGPRTRADATDLIFDLRDTKRHLVEIDAVAFSRYSDYFTEETTIRFRAPGAAVLLDRAGVMESSVVVSNARGRVFEAGTDYTVNGRSGRIRRVSTGAIPVKRALTVRYIALPNSRLSTENARRKTITVDLAATVAPVLPEVEAVVPAFARSLTQTANSITVLHDGRVLRVLVRRPWYSAGLGELLGVAIEPGAGTGVATLTTYARDAINAGTGPVDKPVLAEFTLASETAAAAAIGATFDVAGHEVTFDESRALWTADVLVNRTTLGYRPFVQLALCRFQPNALDGVHVSPVALPDAVRIGASRVVRVTRGTGQVTVRLEGPDRVNQVRVTVQEADPDVADNDLRWRDLGSGTTLARTGTESAAVHSGNVTLPATANARRLLIEDREPLTEDVGGVATATFVTAYREVVDLPDDWV